MSTRRQAYWSELERIAGEVPQYKADGRDKKIEKMAKSQLSEGGSVKVVESGLLRDSWQVQVDTRDQPVSRTRPGFLVYQVKGDDLCRQVEFQYKELHVKKKYQKPNGVLWLHMRFTRCP